MLFQCQTCTAVFKSPIKLKVHNSKDHAACFTCDEVFHDKKRLKEHRQAKHPPTCDLCPGTTFKSKVEVRRHRESAHPGSAWCCLCGKIMEDARSLASHKSTHMKLFKASQEKLGNVSDMVSQLPVHPEPDQHDDMLQVHATFSSPGLEGVEALSPPDNHSPSHHCSSGNQHACEFSSERSISETEFGNALSDGNAQTSHTAKHLTPLLQNEEQGVTYLLHEEANPGESGVGYEQATPKQTDDLVLPCSSRAPSPSVTATPSERKPRNASPVGARMGIFCRICGKDPSDELTATMCGHLFCKRCITEKIIARPACPVCKQAMLLYCLFRIHLEDVM